MIITKANTQTKYSHGYVANLGPDSVNIKMYGDPSDRIGDSPNTNEGWLIDESHQFDGAVVSPLLDGKTYQWLSEVDIVFADIQARQENSDYAVWALPVDNHQFGYFHNRVTETTVTKRKNEHSRRMAENTAIKLLCPLGDDKSTWVMHFACHPNFPLVINATAEAKDLYQTIADYMPTMSSVATTSVSPDGLAEISVSLGQLGGKDMTVYAQTNGGYLPKTQVRSTSGSATFKFRANDLVTGDQVTLKFGTKHYSNLATTIIQVA